MSAEIDTRTTPIRLRRNRLHTDLILAYLGTAKVADPHWRCRRCGRRFQARHTARATVCSIAGDTDD